MTEESDIRGASRCSQKKEAVNEYFNESTLQWFVVNKFEEQWEDQVFNVKFAVHLLGTVALFAIAESGVAQAACSISKSTNDYVCDTTQPAAASSGASSTSKNPSSAAVGGGEPIFMPTPSPSGGSYTPRVAKSFTFNGTSGGTMIREGTPNKIMGISSSIHGETASLVTTAMGLNIDPTVTIIDSSGRVVYLVNPHFRVQDLSYSLTVEAA